MSMNFCHTTRRRTTEDEANIRLSENFGSNMKPVRFFDRAQVRLEYAATSPTYACGWHPEDYRQALSFFGFTFD
jgi:hypothetical protein